MSEYHIAFESHSIACFKSWSDRETEIRSGIGAMIAERRAQGLPLTDDEAEYPYAVDIEGGFHAFFDHWTVDEDGEITVNGLLDQAVWRVDDDGEGGWYRSKTS